MSPTKAPSRMKVQRKEEPKPAADSGDDDVELAEAEHDFYDEPITGCFCTACADLRSRENKQAQPVTDSFWGPQSPASPEMEKFLGWQ